MMRLLITILINVYFFLFCYRFTYLIFISFVLLICITLSECKSSSSTAKNHELLSKIGFSRVRAPNSHHRKRLAVESRHHTRSDDSHMFIIKLPPNQHYYVHNKPNNYLVDQGKKLPLGFKSNGKPAKIYHWNIPVLKKINSHRSKMRLNDAPMTPIHTINRHDGRGGGGGDGDGDDGNNNHDMTKLYKNTWNEVLDKPEKSTRNNYKKLSYYVPSKPKKSSFFKYFPGNGKPQSFYVIEKSKKPHYHRLLP